MNSKCPQCHTEVEHEDYLFEVTCTKCKVRFNPFFESKNEDPVEAVEGVNPLESQKTFQDIIAFGENLKNGLEPEAAPKPVTKANKAEPENSTAAQTQTHSAPINAAGILFFTAAGIPGKELSQTFAPVSVLFAPQAGNNPLDSAVELLSGLVNEKGANGLISLQVQFSSDLSKGIAWGIPVIYV